MLISNLWRAARNPGAAPAVPQRPEWTSQRAFIIASAASAVGLGNIWRFPYMVGENGGGTFIVAYAICIVIIGLPLFILETSAGSILDRGPVGGFRRIAGRWGTGFGWFIVAMVIVIMSYYLVITGWTLGYFLDAVRSDIRPFDEFVSGYASVWYSIVVGVLVFLVLRQGTGGIERLGKVLMPGLMLVVGALAVYGQFLEGAADAMAFYVSFDLDRFLRLRTWLMAAGQAFFSLGVGTGVLITYGSYVPRNVNIVSSSSSVALMNSAISLTAGVFVFSVVHTFGIAPDTGSELSFVALPAVMEEMAGGRFVAIAFFGLLFLAAFTSCYSILMVVMAPLRDELRMRNTTSALLTTGATIVVGIPSALSFSAVELSVAGKPVLDWVDQLAGSALVVVVGIVGAALISWLIPRRDLVDEMIGAAWQGRPVRLLCRGMVEAGRYMPASALVLLALTLLV